MPGPARALLTVTGADRPGVTARLFAELAGTSEGGPPVEVLDVEQVVVHGHLVLGVVVGALPGGNTPADDEQALLERLGLIAREVAAAVGVHVAVESASDPEPTPTGRPHHVILLGDRGIVEAASRGGGRPRAAPLLIVGTAAAPDRDRQQRQAAERAEHRRQGARRAAFPLRARDRAVGFMAGSAHRGEAHTPCRKNRRRPVVREVLSDTLSETMPYAHNLEEDHIHRDTATLMDLHRLPPPTGKAIQHPPPATTKAIHTARR